MVREIAIPGRQPKDIYRLLVALVIRNPVPFLVALNLVATLLVYVPLMGERDGRLYPTFGLSTDNIHQYWDGPLYLVVAKAFYDVESPVMRVFPDLPPTYYAAHFPGYPATIRFFSHILGYTDGMLAATIVATSLAIWVFYLLLKDLGLRNKALWLGFLFLFLPPRWLIYHSVGASEPLFILEILTFILFVRRRQYWLAGFAGAAAVLTRSPGILLLVGYGLLVGWDYLRVVPRRTLWSVVKQRLLPMLPFGVAPLLLFGFYQIQYGDFFAYFQSGDNIHLTGAPFASIWPSSIGYNWSEASVWAYLLYGTGILLLWRNGHRDLAVFAGVYYLPLIFVAHHDLVRYMMPIFPLSLIVGYSRLVTAREFKLVMFLILPAIYIYTWSGVHTNLAPPEQMEQLLGFLNGQ